MTRNMPGYLARALGDADGALAGEDDAPTLTTALKHLRDAATRFAEESGRVWTDERVLDAIAASREGDAR